MRLDTGELKERVVKMVEATVSTQAISTRKALKKCKSRRWKEAYEELEEMCMAKRISFPAVIHVDESPSVL